MALAVHERLGHYEVLGPLGVGGMGEVYRARDTRLDRTVAIKVLPEGFSRDASRLARFEREAKALAALSHPGILSVHDFGVHEGTAYAVTELLEGETLRERLAGGALLQGRDLAPRGGNSTILWARFCGGGGLTMSGESARMPNVKAT